MTQVLLAGVAMALILAGLRQQHEHRSGYQLKTDVSKEIAVRHVTRLGTDIYSSCSRIQT